MTKPPVRRSAGPRLPGAPTPPSAAATAPFFNPDGVNQQPAQHVDEAEAAALRAQYEHMNHVEAQAIPVSEGLGADVEFAGVAEGETLEQAIERIRATRKPMGAFTQKLAYAKRPGYYRHWFNDSPGRLEEARAAGWAHVAGTDRRPVTRHVGQGRDNLGQQAHLMEIPEVIYLEDRAEYHRLAAGRVDAIKTRIAAAKPGEAQASDKGKFYDPHEESGASPVQVVKAR